MTRKTDLFSLLCSLCSTLPIVLKTVPAFCGKAYLWCKGPSVVGPDHLKVEDPDMPADCAEELRVSERKKTHNLLTADGTGVCSLLQCEDFSSLNHLIDVATLILRISVLYSEVRLRDTPGSRVMREELQSNC